jgi:hypothetical protein
MIIDIEGYTEPIFSNGLSRWQDTAVNLSPRVVIDKRLNPPALPPQAHQADRPWTNK